MDSYSWTDRSFEPLLPEMSIPAWLILWLTLRCPGHSGTRWRSLPASVENKAELVLGIHRRPYDSPRGAKSHVQTSWRKRSGGKGKSLGVRVSTRLSCFSHRRGRRRFGLCGCSAVCRLEAVSNSNSMHLGSLLWCSLQSGFTMG